MSLLDPVQIALPVLEVRWHNSLARWVRSESPLVIGADTYIAVPRLEIKTIELTGGVEDPDLEMLVSDDVEPIRNMTLGPHAPVTVRIGRAFLLPTPAVEWIWQGEIKRTETRPDGQARTVKCTLCGRKQDFKDVSLGIKCGNRCAWRFGASPCEATVASVSATIAAISGPEITFSSLPADTAKGDWMGRYTRGSVEVNGLRLLVVQHLVTQGKLLMAMSPPQHPDYTWVGATATVREGCDKTVEACKAHGQDENFGGYGISMPNHNPIYEDADF